MKRIETIRTKLDGLQRIEWWDEEEFRGRATCIYTGESAEAHLKGVPTRELIPETVIPIPDDCILCDFCNESITEFPVPVFSGYALCPDCYKGL